MKRRIGIYHYQYYRGACKLCYRHFIQEMVESYEKCHEVAEEIYGKENCEFLHYTDFGQYDSENTDRPSFRRIMEAIEKKELDVVMCYGLNNITINEEQNADIGRQVDLVDEGLAEEAEIRALVDAERRLFDHEPARRVAREHLERILVGNDADEEQHECGGHQVERRAADGLVGAQVDGGEAQKQGEQRTEGRRHQHREQLHALKRDPVAALLEGEDRVARL